MPSKTLSPTNQFEFACPIFTVEVAMRDCLSLRDKFARGEKIETRRGCQAAMASCKCPIPRVISLMARQGDDPYHASEKRVGTLRPDVLAHIAPIIVQDRHLDAYFVPTSERELLVASNEMAAKGKVAAARPRRGVQLDEIEHESPKARKAETPAADHAAAMSGDMSAAITKAAAREAAAPAPVKAVEPPKPAPAPKAPPKAETPPAAKPEPLITAPASTMAGAPAKRPSLLELARQRAAQAAA